MKFAKQLKFHIKNIVVAKKFLQPHINILLISLLLLSFIIRLINFNLFLMNDDGARDYLVANHIVKYHEFVLNGPESTMLGLKNSPVYFYLLALVVSINNNPLFLGIFNILLQVFTVGIIFMLAQKAFGAPTAVLASILFSFTSINLEQSIFYVWQPFVMQPFVNLGYLLLLLAFIKKNINLILSGVVIFIFAGALHNSVFSLLIFYLLICLLILKRLKANYCQYGSLFLTVILSFIAFYFSPLIYMFKSNLNVLGIANSRINVTFYDFLQHLFNNVCIFIDNFFFITQKGLFSVNMLLLDTTIFAILYFFLYKRDLGYKKLYSIVILIAILCQFIYVSLLRLNDPSLFLSPRVWGALRYFTPIYGLFIILIAHVIYSVFSRKIVLKSAKIILIILFLDTFSQGLGGLFQQTKENFLKPKLYETPAIEEVQKEILSIQEKDNISNLNFFQIKSYSPVIKTGYFWLFLERALGNRFIKNSDSVFNNYKVINDDAYIFLVCDKMNNSIYGEKICVQEFNKHNPNHKLLREIYSQYPLTIYLAKRQ